MGDICAGCCWFSLWVLACGAYGGIFYAVWHGYMPDHEADVAYIGSLRPGQATITSTSLQYYDRCGCLNKDHCYALTVNMKFAQVNGYPYSMDSRTCENIGEAQPLCRYGPYVAQQEILSPFYTTSVHPYEYYMTSCQGRHVFADMAEIKADVALRWPTNGTSKIIMDPAKPGTIFVVGQDVDSSYNMKMFGWLVLPSMAFVVVTGILWFGVVYECCSREVVTPSDLEMGPRV